MMKTVRSLLASSLLLALMVTVSAQTWTPQGPQGGNIINIQATTSKLFAASFILNNPGNIWRSGDDGQTWVNLTGNLENKRIINMWTNNTDTIYLSIEGRNVLGILQDDGGIFRSTDNGDSWTRIWHSTSLNGAPVAFIQKGSILFFGGITGVIRSVDQGETWDALTGGQSGQAIQVKCFEKSGDTIFIGTRKGLFRSLNNCTNWTAASTGIPSTPVGSNWITGMAKSGGILYASTYQKGIYKSTNLAVSWTASNNGLTDLRTQTVFTSGQELFAGTYYDGIYKSSDNAASWSLSTQGLYSQSINRFFQHGNTLYSGGGQGISKSTDNGNNWTDANNDGLNGHIIGCGYGLTDQYLIKGGSYLFASTYQGLVYRSADNGATWQPVSGNIRVGNQGWVRSMAANDTVILVSMDDNKLYQSFDWGDTWSIIAYPENRCPTRMVVVGNRIWAIDDGGLLYFSDDNGNGWTLGSASTEDYYVNMGSKGGDLFLSGYGYNNWNSVYRVASGSNTITLMGYVGDPEASVNSLLALGDTLFASINSSITGAGMGIYKSTNNGIAWTLDGLATTYINGFTKYGNTLFARNKAAIYVRNNADHSWMNITSTLPVDNQSTYSTSMFANDDKLFVALSSRSLFATNASQFTFVPPAQPSAINGAASPCIGSSQVYSVVNVPGVSYGWQFPSGWIITSGTNTNSVTVTVGTSGGLLLVVPSNLWGSGPAQYTFVTTTPSPAQPGSISGPVTPDVGTSQAYSVTNVSGIIYTWSFPSDWAQTAGGNTNSVTVTVGNEAGNIQVTPSNTQCEGPSRILAVTPNVARTLNLKVIPEGLFSASTGNLNKTQDCTDGAVTFDKFAGNIADTLSIQLANPTEPWDIVFKAYGIPVHADGTLSLTIPSGTTGSYYIVVKHRFSVETWSATPVSLTGSSINYDFTTTASQAFGNNQKSMSEGGPFAFYSGDVTSMFDIQDGYVDIFDNNAVFNMAQSGAFGYMVEDLTGDAFVDIFDMAIVFNNMQSAAGMITPPNPGKKK